MADDRGVVGAERVLRVLVALAGEPDGVRLEDLAAHVGSAKSSVHRALTSLRQARLAGQRADGRYVLGDEFLRLAFEYQERRSPADRIEPALRAASEAFGETTHFAVLDGDEVVYRAKRDPQGGAIRLSSVIGGRNPAHATGVGKLLLSYRYPDAAALKRWGETYQAEGRALAAKTRNTITDPQKLAAALDEVRRRGFATDAEESELGVNCVAVPVFLDKAVEPTGAVSVSGLTFRSPLPRLVERVDELRGILRSYDIRTTALPGRRDGTVRHGGAGDDAGGDVMSGDDTRRHDQDHETRETRETREEGGRCV